MIDTEQWQKMSIEEQLGNIGSEVARAFSRKSEEKEKAKQGKTVEAANRALKLFDLTINDKKWRTCPGLDELIQMRAIFKDCFFELGQFNIKEQSINNYFIYFGTIANQKRLQNA